MLVLTGSDDDQALSTVQHGEQKLVKNELPKPGS
jgi:hypothetical protein